MEIGNQIKSLRTQRGVTQEALAEKLGVSAQAVSKWERGSATPDISLLPAISAYFGVSIDELFALSDETRMERIQNMLWDERVLNPDTVEREREFLLEKGRREPQNGKVYSLLADMEFQLAEEHMRASSDYAREGIRREPENNDLHSTFVQANHGAWGMWISTNHHELIDFYKEFVADNPKWRSGYLWLLEQLIDDRRLAEAHEYWNRLAELDDSFRTPLYRAFIALAEGKRDEAEDFLEQMRREHGDDWHVWAQTGDIMAYAGRYEEAKLCYRKGLEIQSAPRYTDGTTAIAHICEIQGDWAGAIAAHEWEMDIIRSEWGSTDGEQIDCHLREIARLRGKMAAQ